MDPKDRKLLTLAIKKNSLQSAKKVLKKKDCLKSSNESYTLLVEALEKKCIGIAKLLLKNGCKVKYEINTKNYDTPLYYAVEINDVELIKLLLEKGSLVSSIDRNSETALYLAFKEKNYEVCKILFSKYFIPSNWCLKAHHLKSYFIARITKNKDAVKDFSKNGLFRRGTYRGSKLSRQKLNLQYAIKENHPELLDLLLISGANVLEKNEKGLTPLDKAFKLYVKDFPDDILSSMYGNRVIYMLKYVDSTENYVGNNGITLFHIACSNENADIDLVKSFLSNNVDINQRIPFNSKFLAGYTPLHCATHFVCQPLIKFLLEHNADINATDKNGVTPFHLLLLRNSSEEIDRSFFNYLYEDSIQNFNNIRIVLAKMFVDKGVDINIQIPINSKINPGYTPLHCAVSSNILLLVAVLFKKELNIFKKDAQGLSPLHLAWTKLKCFYETEKEKCTTIIKYILISYFFEKDHKLLIEEDPVYFHITCTVSNTRYVKYVLDQGVNINSKATLDCENLVNCTPLHCAVHYNRLDVVKLLIQNEADIHLSDENNYTALYKACKLFCDESARKIEYLYKRTLDVFGYENELTKRKFQETIDWDENLRIIELLLELGSDVNARDKSNNPIQFLFFSMDISDMMEYFAMKPLSRNRNQLNQKILDGKEFCKKFAIMRKEIMKLLLNHNLDVNAPNGKGSYLLHKLIQKTVKCDGNIEIAEMILKKGANIDIIDNDCDERWTPVQLAVMQNSTNFMRLLLKYNVNINFSHANKTTLLHTVCIGSKCRSSIINLLVMKNININAKDEDGKTPLFYACQQHPNTCLELLKHGADINVTDKNGKTIFYEIFQDFGTLRYEVFAVIRDHIQKLKLINSIRFNASKTIVDECSRLKQKYSEYLKHNNTFVKKCKDELSLMKNIQIDNYWSLYDFLYKDLNEMAKYNKNTAFTSVLNSCDFKHQYPLFGFFLKLQLKEGDKRRSLINPAKRVLKFLSIVELPDLCSENIFRYFENEEMKNFLKLI